MRPPDDDGSRLWLRYDPLADRAYADRCRELIGEVVMPSGSPTLDAARDELLAAVQGLLLEELPVQSEPRGAGAVVLATAAADPLGVTAPLADELAASGDEGFVIRRQIVRGLGATVIAAQRDVGVLYGVFELILALQAQRPIDDLSVTSTPRIRHRLLDHWDNLDGTIERGYAGSSLWDWDALPERIAPRYRDYARTNASVGINGAVLNNVNANARVLTLPYLRKVAALADVVRPYGIRVYLSARFSAPIELGHLDTADPLDERVVEWWRVKAAEIYAAIPDFGGFLVKANSEGQPGPGDYGRSHAEGANLLAEAVLPHGGIVMWRAFVYSSSVPDDRAKQAYSEFLPLDGAFAKNVLLQVKNGPIDFQPREPFHPLFGAMRKTPLMVEFQLAQEYLGFSTHLVYLGTLMEECLRSDTFGKGPSSSVARVTDGSLDGHALSGIAAVSNTGSAQNWCGHPIAQANWFAFGRLAWDPTRSAAAIAQEWIQMTFGSDPVVIDALLEMLLESREAVVSYMTPLGLHHIMGYDHHYGPAPWIDRGRADWTSVYYHRADRIGLGFDRTSTGSNAVSQYAPEVGAVFDRLETCPQSLLLWFHHVPWKHVMASGRTLWEEVCRKYQEGVDGVRRMQATWAGLDERVDLERFEHVSGLLRMQEKEARWWRDACVLYFQTFSRQPLPDGLDPPEYSLEEYRNMNARR
jgi:alpha-glucuronidase